MKGIKVLIVDNDPMVTESLALIVEKSGHNVVGVGNNGQEGIDLYKTNKPDVVLMDIQMENKNGIDAVKEIMTFNSSAKILILTTFKDEEYIADALKSGAKGYILKQNVDSLIPSLEAGRSLPSTVRSARGGGSEDAVPAGTSPRARRLRAGTSWGPQVHLAAGGEGYGHFRQGRQFL